MAIVEKTFETIIIYADEGVDIMSMLYSYAHPP